jgi:hypothetical protein
MNVLPVLVTLGAMTVGVAHAQPAITPRETAYGRALAQRLGRTGGEVTRLQFPMPTDAATGIVGVMDEASAPAETPAAARPQVNGVRVELDGVQVDRLRFATPEQAREYMARHTGEGQTPTFSELRGNQVVVVKGAPVRDPAFVTKLRRSVWGGLPAPTKSDATGVQMDGDVAVVTRQTEGPIWDSINKAVLAGRRNAGNPGVEMQTPDRARVSLAGGLRAQVQSDAQGASVWSTTKPEHAELIERHLAALGNHPKAPATSTGSGGTAATEGAARRLDRIFGR